MAADIAMHPDKPMSFEPRHSDDKASTGSGDTSSPPITKNTLNVALESSMKIWQPSGARVAGDLFSTRNVLESTPGHLSAALDYSWMDFPKPSSGYKQKEYFSRGVDRSSLSSESRSASHSPSPTPSNNNSGSNCFISQQRVSPTVLTSSRATLPTGGALPAAETFSRKVFVGGLPPDIDQGFHVVMASIVKDCVAADEIREQFIKYGPLTVDWPHKAQSKAYFPPKGYAFLLFRDEIAVQRLVDHCLPEDGKLFTFVSSVTQTNKKVQIRPWVLSDSDYIMDHTQPIDPRKTIFIGGVPRPLKALELADIFNSRYGNVCYAGIDCDPELKYPKGAGRVTFSSRVSFMSAVSCRFLQVTYGDIDKKVEVKPYVLDDQMCDECHGVHCNGRYAPYFCGNIHCLRYYCEHCWASIHSAPGTQNHRCFIKENGDRPRAISFFPTQRPTLTLP